MSALAGKIKRNVANRIGYFSNQMVDEIGKQAVYLQLLILVLILFRIVFAVFALTGIHLLTVVWNLVVTGVLAVGFISARSRNQLLILCYIAVIGAVVVLSVIDFLVGIFSNWYDDYSFTWQILSVVFTAIHVVLEAASVLQAWKLYRMLITSHPAPHVPITLPGDGSPQAVYIPEPTDAELGYELQERQPDVPAAGVATGTQAGQPSSVPYTGQPPSAYPPPMGSTPYGLAPSFVPMYPEGQPQGGAAVAATSELYPITYDSGQQSTKTF